MHLEREMLRASIQGELYVTLMQEITVIYMSLCLMCDVVQTDLNHRELEKTPLSTLI